MLSYRLIAKKMKLPINNTKLSLKQMRNKLYQFALKIGDDDIRRTIIKYLDMINGEMRNMLLNKDFSRLQQVFDDAKKDGLLLRKKLMMKYNKSGGSNSSASSGGSVSVNTSDIPGGDPTVDYGFLSDKITKTIKTIFISTMIGTIILTNPGFIIISIKTIFWLMVLGIIYWIIVPSIFFILHTFNMIVQNKVQEYLKTLKNLYHEIIKEDYDMNVVMKLLQFLFISYSFIFLINMIGTPTIITAIMQSLLPFISWLITLDILYFFKILYSYMKTKLGIDVKLILKDTGDALISMFKAITSLNKDAIKEKIGIFKDLLNKIVKNKNAEEVVDNKSSDDLKTDMNTFDTIVLNILK